MNHLQLLLLKLSEEAGEVLTEALALEKPYPQTVPNYVELQDEIFDFLSVVHYLNQKYSLNYIINGDGFDIPQHVVDDLSDVKGLPVAELVDFWALISLDLTKIASKAMQFGLYEVCSKLDMNNRDRLVSAIYRFEYCMRAYANIRKLSCDVPVDYVSQKIEKIERYAQYSNSLGCLSLKDVDSALYQPALD